MVPAVFSQRGKQTVKQEGLPKVALTPTARQSLPRAVKTRSRQTKGAAAPSVSSFASHVSRRGPADVKVDSTASIGLSTSFAVRSQVELGPQNVFLSAPDRWPPRRRQHAGAASAASTTSGSVSDGPSSQGMVIYSTSQDHSRVQEMTYFLDGLRKSLDDIQGKVEMFQVEMTKVREEASRAP